eukprot:TRINITY_DN139_c1_g3_i1.p1 TRINITY_DN139_c1_g3~~TRINITY_DN139_c1_g3_i1.p1  ORF type:complete len:298 (+),score=61.04 TRINITY_DN139_c1_g3_i1:33-926(+)
MNKQVKKSYSYSIQGISSPQYITKWKTLITLEPSYINLTNLTFTITWSDQGWGNRKGQIHLVVIRNNVQIFSHSLFGIAPHEKGTSYTSLDDIVDFVALQSGDELALYHTVGGGGGHRLFVEVLDVCLVYEKIARFRLNKLRHSFCDFKLVSEEGESVEVSKVVLANSSDYFLTYLGSQWTESAGDSAIVEMGSQILHIFINGLYELQIDEDESTDVLIELFRASDRYQVSWMYKDIEYMLKMRIDESNLYQIFECGTRYMNDNLLGYCWDFVESLEDNKKDMIEALKNIEQELSNH